MPSVPNTFSFLSLIKAETMQLCKSSCSINTVVLQNWCKPMSQKIRESLLDFQFSFIICAFLSIFESKSKISSVSSHSNFSKYWFSIPLFSRDRSVYKGFKDSLRLSFLTLSLKEALLFQSTYVIAIKAFLST